MKLYYPVKPLYVNQGFGANKDYYLSNFGTHMGLDYAAGHGQPVYAAHDGQAVFVRDEHGGEGIHLYGQDVYFYDTDTQQLISQEEAYSRGFHE